MRVLIVRHASAVERGTPGVVESERALTPRGRRRFRQAARGLAALLPRPDALLSSPLRRARQTATLLARAWGAGVAVQLTPDLAQGGPAPVVKLLRAQGQKQLVALVGHEPYLSALIAQLVDAQTSAAFALRKGGAALLDWDGSRRPAHLLWLLPPKVLRRLA
jgi:phosphohistidine phosphatase